jgi:hypothetical protein
VVSLLVLLLDTNTAVAAAVRSNNRSNTGTIISCIGRCMIGEFRVPKKDSSTPSYLFQIHKIGCDRRFQDNIFGILMNF